jgi:bacillithiol synthase
LNEKRASPSPANNHAARTASIPFSLIQGQSRLFLDYQRDPTALLRYYPNAAASLTDVRSFVSEVLSGFGTDRAALCRALGDINAECGSGAATFANIRRLGAAGTVAVVTGQQAGLFTGPLYTIYKALSSIKAAEILTAAGIEAVPVFWIASEDHDFDEVSQAFVVDGAGEIAEIKTGPGKAPAGVPVGSIVLDGEISAVVGTLAASLPAAEFTGDIAELLSDSWHDGAGFAAAFGKTMARLFSRYGLILLDPMNAEMKRLASPMYVRAAESANAIVAALTARGRELTAAGYHNQVLVGDDYFPLFWHTEKGIRSSLRRIGDGRYRSKEDKREFATGELVELASRQPERFSPGVMLRGVVQDHLLPTVCYFGGGAEVAYFAQSGEVYRVLRRPVTPVFHRQSFTVVEPRFARTLDEYSLELTDLFGGIETLVPRIVETIISPETAQLFSDAEERINMELNRLDQALSGLDGTLAESLAKRRRKILYHIAALRRKAYRSEMLKNEVIERRIRSAYAALSPGGQLQERVLNFTHFYNKYGPYFIDRMYRATDIEEREHRLIYL